MLVCGLDGALLLDELRRNLAIDVEYLTEEGFDVVARLSRQHLREPLSLPERERSPHYVVRQKIAGTHLTYGYVTQLPVFSPSVYDSDWSRSFIESRVLELTYTAWDMEPFARDLGDDGPPFRWDSERRFVMRCELDALFFRLYGIDRDDVDYIMETFPIVKRKDIAAHAIYRTKDKILEIYDAMAGATRAESPYQAILTPPPGHGRRHAVR